MRIVVDINHPAQVHYFKHFIWEMKRKGHEILVTASNKEISYRLLDGYGIDYKRLGSYGTTLGQKLMNIPLLDIKMYDAVKGFKPDIFFGFGSQRNAHVSRLLRKRCIAFEDSEPSVDFILYVPFTDAVLTPTCFKKDLGKRQVRYNGYTELAYLHPKYFTPDPSVMDEIGVGKNEDYVVMRYVGWKAGHDVGRGGFDLKSKVAAVKALEKHAKVFITSELPLPDQLEPYRINVDPTRIHDVLYYAKMLVGDSQTMTTEAALLGTPAIRCNTFVGENDMGNFIELEKQYGLIFNYDSPSKGIEKALELVGQPGLKAEWAHKREQLIRDKIDVTAFMVWFVENYPQSFHEASHYSTNRQSGEAISG